MRNVLQKYLYVPLMMGNLRVESQRWWANVGVSLKTRTENGKDQCKARWFCGLWLHRAGSLDKADRQADGPWLCGSPPGHEYVATLPWRAE